MRLLLLGTSPALASAEQDHIYLLLDGPAGFWLIDCGGSAAYQLLRHGYDAIPVNPYVEELDGKKCFKSIKDILPAPERALLLLPEDKTEQAVIDCADAGIQHVWLHRHVAGGVSDTRAIFRAEERGLSLVTGFCMFMFLPRSPFIHKLHGGVMKLIGIYPK